MQLLLSFYQLPFAWLSNEWKRIPMSQDGLPLQASMGICWTPIKITLIWKLVWAMLRQTGGGAKQAMIGEHGDNSKFVCWRLLSTFYANYYMAPWRHSKWSPFWILFVLEVVWCFVFNCSHGGKDNECQFFHFPRETQARCRWERLFRYLNVIRFLFKGKFN